MVATDDAAAQVSAVCEPVFELSSTEQLTSLRIGGVGGLPKYEPVLEALLSLEDGNEAMVEFMQANRDLLDYRFLYRLTSELLQATNTGKVELAAKLDAARSRAVKAAQRFDTAVFKQVADAESRLGGLLAQYMQGKKPKANAVVNAAGSEPQSIFAFWMVLIAAIAAWESKLSAPAVEAQAREKLAQLSELRTAVEDDDALMSAAGISPMQRLFRAVGSINVDSGEIDAGCAAQARTLFAELETDPLERLRLVRRIGCTYCQAQRHGFQAYNPLVQQTAALYDMLLHGEQQPLAAVDIMSPQRKIESGMVQMAYDSDKILAEAGVEIPLFW